MILKVRCALWAAWHVMLFRLRSARRDMAAGSNLSGGSWGDQEPERPHYFTVDVSPVMHARLLEIMGKATNDPTNRGIVEALELAERVSLPFTPPVDWDSLERKARDGYSVADQIFDHKRRMDQ